VSWLLGLNFFEMSFCPNRFLQRVVFRKIISFVYIMQFSWTLKTTFINSFPTHAKTNSICHYYVLLPNVIWPYCFSERSAISPKISLIFWSAGHLAATSSWLGVYLCTSIVVNIHFAEFWMVNQEESLRGKQGARLDEKVPLSLSADECV
jgi:hypothetical protein